MNNTFSLAMHRTFHSVTENTPLVKYMVTNDAIILTLILSNAKNNAPKMKIV